MKNDAEVVDIVTFVHINYRPPSERLQRTKDKTCRSSHAIRDDIRN